VVGPLSGPPPTDRAEAEALFADTPALAGQAHDERLALIVGAHPVDLEPGVPVILPGPTHAVVVESGVIATPDGVELRRGTLVGPVGDGDAGTVAETRTPVRLWVIPDASTLPPLAGAVGHVVAGPPRPAGPAATASGVHGAGVYPPLAVPPCPPDGTEDPEVDRRFKRRMWWLVLLVLLLALLLTVANFAPGPVWAEMPADRALLTADRGPLTVVAGDTTTRLAEGSRRYVGEGSSIEVPAGSTGRLTFPGGSAAVLCAGSRTNVDRLWTDPGRHHAPHGTLGVDTGRLLVDTAGTSGAFRPLSLVVLRPSGDVKNRGKAWYAVDPGAVTVSTGSAVVAGVPVAATLGDLTCGDGVVVTPPAAGPSEEPSSGPPTEVTPSPSVPPTTVTVPTTIPQPTRTTRPNAGTTTTTTTPATTKPPATTTKPPTTTPTPTTSPPTTTPSSPSTSPSPSRTTTSPSPTPSPSDSTSTPPIIT
jgi:putative peptide zinc metalloprotease protein